MKKVNFWDIFYLLNMIAGLVALFQDKILVAIVCFVFATQALTNALERRLQETGVI